MALSPFFGGRSSSLWDPWSSSFWNPTSTTWTRMLHDSEPVFSFAKDVQAVMNTRIDWKESNDAHIITADLPGLSKENVKVELEDKNTIKISGERRKEEVMEGDKWHCVERAAGKFMRSFHLPDNADSNNISATFNNGVLVLTVPKAKKTKMESRSIEITHSGSEGASTIGLSGSQDVGGAPQGTS